MERRLLATLINRIDTPDPATVRAAASSVLCLAFAPIRSPI